jgi:hypothetical protein
MRLLGLKSGGGDLHLSPPAGRGRIALAIRVRGALSKRGGNRFKYTRHITEHVVVPKPQHSIVVIGKPFVTNNVARVIRVLSSIDFNDKTSFATNEIDCIRTIGSCRTNFAGRMLKLPLTRIASQSDLSPHAGRG